MSNEPKPVVSDDSSKAPEDGDGAVCGNCAQTGAKLRCTRCKNRFYCCRDCQKSDWPFHRRTCKTPAQKKKEEEKAKEDKAAKKREKKAKKAGSSTSTSSASSGSGTSSSTTKKAASAPVRSGGKDTLVADEEDEEALREIKKGYRYFSRELPDHEKELIGDITPKAISAAGAGDTAAPAPMPAKLESTGSQLSSWNSNTFEERDVTAWAKERLTEQLMAVEMEIPDGTLSVTGHESFDGFLQVAFTRGKKRYIYDFKYKALVDVTVGSKTGKLKVEFVDISAEDEDWDVAISWDSTGGLSSRVKDSVRAMAKSPSGELYKQLRQATMRLLSDFREEK